VREESRRKDGRGNWKEGRKEGRELTLLVQSLNGPLSVLLELVVNESVTGRSLTTEDNLERDAIESGPSLKRRWVARRRGKAKERASGEEFGWTTRRMTS